MSAPADPTPAELGTLAVTLAEGAADVVRTGRAAAVDSTGGRLVTDTKSSDTDLVTEVDRRTEAWLVDAIARQRPADAVLGEEGGGRAGTSDVRWVLDPIDGTVNFVLGVPHYAVSVAAEVAGEVVAGAVCDVPLGETFRAVRGAGAFIGDTRLSGRRQVPPERAVVGTGFGYDPRLKANQAAVIAKVLPQVADIRRLGSAALALCYVAAGRLDGYFESGLHYWDWAAGALVAAEAGCEVSGPRAGPPASAYLLAAAPPLLSPLRDLLTAAGAEDVTPA